MEWTWVWYWNEYETCQSAWVILVRGIGMELWKPVVLESVWVCWVRDWDWARVHYIWNWIKSQALLFVICYQLATLHLCVLCVLGMKQKICCGFGIWCCYGNRYQCLWKSLTNIIFSLTVMLRATHEFLLTMLTTRHPGAC